jgi:hypothetical protein
MNHRALFSAAFLLIASAVLAAAPQPPTAIALDPAIECWPHSQFPLLGAEVTPPEDVVRSRLYFRCSLYPDYWFVDLKPENGAYRGVAPQAEEACPQVHYYVEALERDFTSTRTEERVADVAPSDECRRRNPAAAWFPGDDPNIYLGSTLGATGMAPGFKTVGIVGFISSTGTTVALSTGGVSGGMIAGIAAAGGAAAGLGIVAGGSDSTTTTPPVSGGPPPATTTVPVTTTVPAPSGIRACFTIDPPTAQIEVNHALRVDGRCSEGDGLNYIYDLGDGRTREGQPFITPSWSNPGTYRLTLTVWRETSLSALPPHPHGSRSAGAALGLRAPAARPGAREEDMMTREVHVIEPTPPPASLVADFIAQGHDDTCIADFDGSPSKGDIVRYEWALDLDNKLRSGVIQAEGLRVTHDWDSSCYNSDGYLRSRLTVVGRDGSSASIAKNSKLWDYVYNPLKRGAVESSFQTEILETRGAKGQVSLEGVAAFPVSSEAPARFRFSTGKKQITLDAVATSAGEAFLWRFDFTGAPGFVPGSLRTLSGQEVSRDGYSIVLRFSGAEQERARFQYRLEP